MVDSKNVIKSIFYKKCLYKGKNRYMAFITVGDKHYKVRSTAIIYNKEGEVFCRKSIRENDKQFYYFPGGSLEVDSFKKTSHPPLQLLNHITNEECQKECKIVVTNTRFTGISLIFVYPQSNTKPTSKPDKVYNDSGQEDIQFLNNINGTMSLIYVSEYLKKFTGYVDPSDRSPFATSGVWKKYKDIKELILLKEKEAIEKHVPNSMSNSTENWRMFNTYMN